jgi:hypothetical protein
MVPATERGRHGNGDNRAGTATAGARIPKTIQGIAFLTALCELVPALVDVMAAHAPSICRSLAGSAP